MTQVFSLSFSDFFSAKRNSAKDREIDERQLGDRGNTSASERTRNIFRDKTGPHEISIDCIHPSLFGTDSRIRSRPLFKMKKRARRIYSVCFEPGTVFHEILRGEKPHCFLSRILGRSLILDGLITTASGCKK